MLEVHSSLETPCDLNSAIGSEVGFVIKKMRHFSSLFNGLARSITGGRKKNYSDELGREAADAMAKDAKKKDMILCSSGCLSDINSKCFASTFTQRGEKGVNQDCFLVWQPVWLYHWRRCDSTKEFGCQEDMMFCGVFDGHGPWGHFVAKRVRQSLPSSLLCNWQEALSLASISSDLDLDKEKNVNRFDIWKQSYLRTCAAVDRELELRSDLDSFHSGSTALSIVKQGDLVVIANVGDSRAVLATTSEDGSLVPIQLTVDFKPGLPQEAERITQCKGRVFCLEDEPGVHRIWLPNGETPGLAMSRAFGDYCVKDFGLISMPEVTQRNITHKDQFIVLATDGVWDVISNQEAVEIVASARERGKAAKRLVECAVRAWGRKRRGIAVDDCSAICLFFNSSLPS